MYCTAGESYDSDAVLYFNQAVVQPSSTFKSAVSWFFENLKSTGNYTKMDFMFFAPGSDQTLARTNMKNPSHKLTEVVSSGWLSGNWWAGNSARYLNLNWNPVDDGSNYTRNNAGYTIMCTQQTAAVQMGMYRTPFTNVIIVGEISTTYSINGDQFSGATKKCGAVNTVLRTGANSSAAYRDAVQIATSVLPSEAMTNDDWFGLGWNFLGAIDSPSPGQVLFIAAHSGDIDLSAFNSSIVGLFARLNGGYKLTVTNSNIAGLPALDSALLTQLDDTQLVLIGGYVPGEPSQTYKRFWTSSDGGATWTDRGATPFRMAHALGGRRNDGKVWVYGSDVDTSKSVCYTLTPAGYVWAAVNTDLGAGDLSGLGTVQWGGICNNEMIWAVNDGVGSTTIIKKSTDGNSWPTVSTFPAPYAFNCDFLVDGTTIRVAGGARYTGATMDNFVENIYESTDGALTWTVVRSLPSNLRSSWPKYFKFNGHEFFIRGSSLTTAAEEGIIYRWNGTEWINTGMIGLSTRHAIAGTPFGGAYHLVGGFLFNDSFKIETVSI